jgi:hypothetical protein
VKARVLSSEVGRDYLGVFGLLKSVISLDCITVNI